MIELKAVAVTPFRPTNFANLRRFAAGSSIEEPEERPAMMGQLASNNSFANGYNLGCMFAEGLLQDRSDMRRSLHSKSPLRQERRRLHL